MGINNDKSVSATGLRRRAEDRLRTVGIEPDVFQAGDDTLRLLHELQVHKVELEMQNEDLRQARYELESHLEKYTNLFEFAPIGYVTLDGNREISSVNLAGAGLLGGTRSRLIGRKFELFVAVIDRTTFSDFLGTVLTCRVKESCEVTLLNRAHQRVIVQIEAMATASGQEFRLALIDITDRRRAECALAGKQREIEELNHSLEVSIARAVNDLKRHDH